MGTINVISANLPILRELRGRIGQHELAERVGVSRRTIARLESGEVADPGIDLMRRIAAELGVSLSFLTETRIRAVTVPLPEEICGRLGTKDAARILEAMIHAARAVT